MARNKQRLLIEQLDEKLRPFHQAKTIIVPEKGWIHTIRTTLNMTMAQLGNKLNITRQGIKKMEDSEANGTLTLNSLKDVAHALDMQLVYAIVPKQESIDDFITEKAEKLAQKIVLRTNQNMKLENQGIGDDKLNKTIQDLSDELKRDMSKSLWD
ncbi:MAG: mobile mystery protein A [Allomuricauda sp.]